MRRLWRDTLILYKYYTHYQKFPPGFTIHCWSLPDPSFTMTFVKWFLSSSTLSTFTIDTWYSKVSKGLPSLPHPPLPLSSLLHSSHQYERMNFNFLIVYNSLLYLIILLFKLYHIWSARVSSKWTPYTHNISHQFIEYFFTLWYNKIFPILYLHFSSLESATFTRSPEK